MKKLRMIFSILFLIIIASCTNEVITTNNEQITTGEEITTTNQNTTENQTSTETTTTVIDELPIELQSCGNPFIGDFRIVWCDEFDYNGTPDPTKWKFDLGAGGWGNNELQHYTSREDNAIVANGHLTIAAIKEDYYGSEYTSARLVSKDTGSFQYGRIEIKAKLPSGRGTWSALWMLPTSNLYGGWPNSGEIDIMEHVGYSEGTIYGTIHTEKYNHKLGSEQGENTFVSDATSEFHVYALEWYPRELRFFVDEKEYYVYRFNELNDSGSDYHKAWPFDQSFHIIMNIAMGGSWGGAQGIDSTLNYTDMLIDYVRVYQQDYTKGDVNAPSIPQMRTGLTSTSPKTATISWFPSVDNQHVKGYQIFLNDEFYDNSFSSSYEFSGLQPNTIYQVSVKAEDFAGNVSESGTLEFTTDALATIPGIIEAENYLYISNGSIRASSDDNTFVVTGLKKNDYIIYTFEVLEEGEYELSLRLSNFTFGQFAVYLVDEEGNHVQYIGATDIPATGGYDKWLTIVSNQSIYLDQGVSSIKIFARTNISGDAFWLNWIKLEKKP